MITEERVPGGMLTTRPPFITSRLRELISQLRNPVTWARRWSLWPLPFGTACCGIEVMALGASRYDVGRFGAEAMRFTPRQSDLLICAGRVAIKMMPILQRTYRQMTEPKWVMSMGACASTGGEFNNYATVQGVDQFIPVDVYVPGCPPRPEQLLEGLMLIQRLIDEGKACPSYERAKGMRMRVKPPAVTDVATVTSTVNEALRRSGGLERH
jgi:NADH-quinone oxidoreductase subunit B